MTVIVGDRLEEMSRAERDWSPAAIRDHYAALGVDPDEMVDACARYFTNGGAWASRPGVMDMLPVAVALAGRMLEVGVGVGREELREQVTLEVCAGMAPRFAEARRDERARIAAALREGSWHAAADFIEREV